MWVVYPRRCPRVVQRVCSVLFDTAAFGPPPRVVSMRPCWTHCASFDTSAVGSWCPCVIQHVDGGLVVLCRLTYRPYPCCLEGAVISGGDKGRDGSITHKTGLPLPGSLLVISLIPSSIQLPLTIFVVAHIPLVRGGALRELCEPGCSHGKSRILNRVWLMMD